MKLSKQRKLYILLLGLAGTALVVDRLILPSPATGPASADASLAANEYVSPQSLLVNPTATPSDAIEAPLTPPQGVWQRLAELAPQVDLQKVPDAFAAGWSAAPAVAVVGAEAPAAFARRHRLLGVMALDQGGWAIIDGRTLPIGQSLDGFRLDRVTHRTAVLTGPSGEEVVLTLTDDRG